MQTKNNNAIKIFNICYFIVFIHALLIRIITLWISFGNTDTIFSSITTAQDTIMFYKNQHYGLLIIFLIGVGLWYLINIFIFFRTQKQQETISIKHVMLYFVVFLSNLFLSLITGSFISATANGLKNIQFTELIYKDRAMIKNCMDHANITLYLILIILIAEIVLWILKYQIKARKPRQCLILCGTALLPYYSLLFTLNY